MKINYNVAAFKANTQLLKADSNLTASLQRLSSGYKLSKPSDDPAGKAISKKMKSQIAALERSSQNAADGNSILQTAEGAMTEMHSMLQRIRELSVQAANDVYVLDDKVSIQHEIDALLDEIDRISTSTEYNNKYLLNGSIGRTAVPTSDLVRMTEASNDIKAGTYEVTVTSVGEPAVNTVNYTPGTEPYTIFINGAEVIIEPTDTVETARQKVVSLCAKINVSIDDNTITTNVTGEKQSLSVWYSYDLDDKVTTYGKDAKVDLSAFDSDSITYISDGDKVKIIDDSGFEMSFELKEGFTAGETFEIKVYDSGSLTLQIGANEGQVLDVNIPEVSAKTLGLRDSKGTDIINVCTGIGAQNSIAAVEEAIELLSEVRSQVGAYQNRLEHTISSLDISVENMTQALSRITDTDMAAEMTRYTQYSVLSQAATSMLAQANARPQQIMSLLQG